MSLLKSLYEKKFSIKTSGLSYRTINNWSEKGLISHLRDKAGQWHKLAILDLIELRIYSELREMGVPIKKLKMLKTYFHDKSISLSFHEEDAFFGINELTYHCISTWAGLNIFLVIDSQITLPEFLRYDDLLSRLGNQMMIQSLDTSPLLVISLREVFRFIGIPYDMKDESMGIIVEEIVEGENDRDIKISISKNEIKKITLTEHINYKNITSVNKLVNRPNRKTIFSSNNYGAQKITIKRPLRNIKKSPIDEMISKAEEELKKLSKEDLARLGRDENGRLKNQPN